jgi:hypothetical protein
MNRLVNLFIAAAIISGGTICFSENDGIHECRAALTAAGKAVTISEIKLLEDSEIFKSNLRIPAVSGMKNKNTQSKINDIFKTDALKFRDEIKKLAETTYEDSKKYSIPIPHKYTAETAYEVRYNRKNLLSITVMYYQYTGGAHGLEVQKAYNFNLETGKQLELSDLFPRDFNYREIIGEEVLNYMKTHPGDFFPFDESSIKETAADKPFYIEDGNLVIYYDLYEIAPYAAGIPEFRIPFSKLNLSINLRIGGI